MAYEFSDIRTSQEIFYHLLMKRELREEDEPYLYQAYTEQEQIQNLVKSQGDAAESFVEGGEGVVWLICEGGKDFLGFW